MKLTEKQRRFADEYIANKGNATQAAIAAGYSERSASVTGTENLRKPNIAEYIKSRTEKAETDRIAKGDEVLMFLTAVMRGDIEDTYITRDGEFVGYVDQKNQINAAQTLARFHGLLTQKVEHEGSVNVTFIDDLDDDV